MEREISTKFFVSPSLSASIAGDDRSSPARNIPFYLHEYGVLSSEIDVSYFSAEDYSVFPQIAMDPSLKLKPPKMEPMESWISTKNDSSELCQLPDLLSLEPMPDLVERSPYPPPLLTGDLISIIESSNKRFRSSFHSSPPPPPPPPPPLTFQERVWTIHNPNPNPRPLKLPSTEMSRRRRKKISDRTRILETLMPWERRMDIGTMLEEAEKYIKFLEAQVTALQTMPMFSAGFEPVPIPPGRTGCLERLNRQQLLQVMVNSSMVQDLLYKRGLCVFSAEQVLALRRQMVDGKAQVMLLLGSAAVSR